MNVGRLKVGAELVGGVLIATFFVVLLSYIFSFLGTIFCAALCGMMLGAMRMQKWQSVPVSLIFPLVIFGLLRGMKAELSGRQMLVIAIACFSVFWLAYAIAAALFVLERPKAGPAGQRSTEPLKSAAIATDTSSIVLGQAQADETPRADGLLSLEMLQGNWSGELNSHPGAEKRRLSIENSRLTLSIVDSGNRVKVLAQANVKVCTNGSAPTLLISHTNC